MPTRLSGKWFAEWLSAPTTRSGSLSPETAGAESNGKFSKTTDVSKSGPRPVRYCTSERPRYWWAISSACA